MSVAEPLAPTQTVVQPSLRMTYEEFLAWADEDVHAEWVDGEVIVQMPPKDPHQTLVRFLTVVIDLFVEIFELGRVWVAPFEVKLWPDGPSREPDLLFLANEHLDRLTPERVVGAPDLVVEIVSDDSVHRDRVDKYDEYEKAGVPEYWIVDNRTGRQRAHFYQLGPNGEYHSVPIGADGVYHSAVLPGFRLRVEWLWQAEPDTLRALVEVVGPEQLGAAVRRVTGADANA